MGTQGALILSQPSSVCAEMGLGLVGALGQDLPLPHSESVP